MKVQRTIGGLVLRDDEEILHNQKPSWRNWSRQLLVIGVIGLLTAGLGLVLLFFPWRARNRTRYVVTTDRIVVKHATWRSTRIDDYPMDRVTSTSVGSRTVSFGSGYVQVSVSGTDDTVVLSGVTNQEQLSNTIQQQRRKRPTTTEH